MKTSELTGPALDWAVAKCEKSERQPIGHPAHFSPSTNWAQGGPIIEREGIAIKPFIDGGEWLAKLGSHQHDATTPLVAAMRCFVASRLGEEVDIPAELKD